MCGVTILNSAPQNTSAAMWCVSSMNVIAELRFNSDEIELWQKFRSLHYPSPPDPDFALMRKFTNTGITQKRIEQFEKVKMCVGPANEPDKFYDWCVDFLRNAHDIRDLCRKMEQLIA